MDAKKMPAILHIDPKILFVCIMVDLMRLFLSSQIFEGFLLPFFKRVKRSPKVSNHIKMDFNLAI